MIYNFTYIQNMSLSQNVWVGAVFRVVIKCEMAAVTYRAITFKQRFIKLSLIIWKLLENT